MTTSEQTDAIAAALAKAQGAMKNATLNKTNPHFRSKYADLAGIRDAVTPALAANGIAVLQTLDDGAVLTRLLHSSGQWVESRCPIPAVTDMQKMGSAITYARRYSLSAICGIAADEDDDGNVASTDPLTTFDEVGYRAWLSNLATTAKASTFGDLVETIKAGRADYQDALRADRKAWADLKGLCREAMPA